MTLTGHYRDETDENSRLTRSPHGRLEFLRTQELVRRVLPPPLRTVLDIGGATGVHARWLAADGYAVHVVDPVPGHVAAASEIDGVTAEIGDARALTWPDDSADVVLLMGPLYHLTEPADRARALAEARRVLRPGGLLFAAAISRYLSAMEAGTTGRLAEQMGPGIETVIATGQYDAHVGFVPAHFHTADELRDELRTAGWEGISVYGVEGPSWPALDIAGLAEFDAHKDAALSCARLLEQDPLLINASAHFLAVAEK